ncbi:hypothetical protein [Methylobacterium sp. 37f]|uniref:hypothetical protein n=1 Tax=Methylobacterium sp. 37f TaxID=2817058 RepID=UPI001FFD3AE1|nr:hypothetical protein [Methylobacterium sp. 37f]MCK2056913.1 hypothetical protein [Methylobacterium sp. 37f]
MTEQAYHGTPSALRDFVAECLNMTAFYSGMAVDYAAAGDDVLLDVSVRRAIAALRQGASTLQMLKEENAKLLHARQVARAEREGADAALGL